MTGETDSDVPLPGRSALKVGIIYNLQKESVVGAPVDAEAEYDSIETVHALQAALQTAFSEVVLLEDDGTLPEKLKQRPIDIAFNIAEGRGGRGREAQVPAQLEYYGIPFTGSDATTLAVALDKALTKRIVASYGVNTPRSVLVGPDGRGRDMLSKLRFPLIVKPDAEGSGKGISEVSIAGDDDELDKLLEHNLAAYGCDMLVEEYIAGKEYTVGLLGNGDDVVVFRPMELSFRRHTQDNFDVYSYSVKKHYKDFIDYVCPAPLSAEAETKMTAAARTVFDALSCRDFARVDFRTDADGELYFIEVNPLPGLAPGYSDYPMLAEFCGVGYNELAVGVIDAALKRLKLKR